MEETLVVFRENQHHFGILPHEFDRHISLDDVTVAPVDHVSSLWSFDCRQKSLRGYFVHLGNMMELKHTLISHQGYLFLKKYDDQKHWGIFLNDIYLQTPRKRIENKIIQSTEKGYYPNPLSSEILHSRFRLRRKDVWIVNPAGLFQQFQEKMSELATA